MKVLSDKELKVAYGDFYEKSELANFDVEDVPVNLRFLAPYARFWGLSDDTMRLRLVDQAPSPFLSELKQIVKEFDDLLDVWLAGPEAMTKPSSAYVAYSAMRMCSDMY